MTTTREPASSIGLAGETTKPSEFQEVLKRLEKKEKAKGASNKFAAILKRLLGTIR